MGIEPQLLWQLSPMACFALHSWSKGAVQAAAGLEMLSLKACCWGIRLMLHFLALSWVNLAVKQVAAFYKFLFFSIRISRNCRTMWLWCFSTFKQKSRKSMFCLFSFISLRNLKNNLWHVRGCCFSQIFSAYITQNRIYELDLIITKA